jgi:outer membrane receptor protein involved in Fe transport
LGKNASAGVVNIVTKKPSFENFGKATFEIGDYNSKVAKIYYTGPINDSVAYSFSANVNKRDGQSDNPTTGNKLNDRDRFGYRAELLFAPADDFSARVTVDYDEFDEICCVIGSTAYGAGNQITALLGGKVVPNDPFTQSSFFNFDPTSKGENGGISLHIEKNFTNTTLESITSYRTSDNYEVQDIDFDAADVIAPSPISKDLSGVTQEIRWYTEDNEKVNWLVGGFYYQEDMDFNESVYFGTHVENIYRCFLAWCNCRCRLKLLVYQTRYYLLQVKVTLKLQHKIIQLSLYLLKWISSLMRS